MRIEFGALAQSNRPHLTRAKAASRQRVKGVCGEGVHSVHPGNRGSRLIGTHQRDRIVRLQKLRTSQGANRI